MARIIPAEVPPINRLDLARGAEIKASDFREVIEGSHLLYSREGSRGVGEIFPSPLIIPAAGEYEAPWHILKAERPELTPTNFNYSLGVWGTNFRVQANFFFNGNASSTPLSFSRTTGEGFGQTDGSVALVQATDLYRLRLRIFSEDGVTDGSVSYWYLFPTPLDPSNPW